MTKKKKIVTIILTILILGVILGSGVYVGLKKHQAQTAQKALENKALNKKLAKKTTDLIGEIAGDIVLGDKNAPITIIEYASLSCPHCANFHEDVFSKIKKEYVDKNKVKFIYRDFPLNQSALLASLTAHCYAKNNNYDPKKYYNFIKVLFKNQDNWAFDENFFEKIKSIAKLSGMTSDEFQKCSVDQKMLDKILKKRQKAAQELQIQSTPSFILNGQKLINYHGFKKFKKAIDQELNK